MEQPFVLDDEEQDPEPQQRSQEPIQVLDEDADDDAELIFVGVENVKEDAELIFVGVTSTSQPANSNILNRVTPGSRLKRKYDRLRETSTGRLQPSRPAPPAEAVIVLPASPAESRSTDSPIIIEPSSESDYKSNSPQVVPSSSSKCCSPLVTLSSSESSPVKAALSGGDVKENLYVSKCHFSINPQRPENSIEIHTTCLRCHRQFDSPFQLECHIDRVHTAPDPSVVCKICELSFETDQVLLQHMKDNHKPGEMPYVCQVCKYRSSVFADVETHF
ncbi:zinc finger protein 280B-like, partial [Mastomys coucha]|uniref:zinc finger protein 280B-like n=1 Tax=Mastomys coucha TaxID=35658 RepID=UPI001262A0CB